MKTRSLAFLACLTLLGGSAALSPGVLAAEEPGAKAAPKRFEVADFAKLVDLSDPQISPDGKSIVVVVTRANLEENRYDSSLVLVDVASGERRELTQGRKTVGSPRWSPSGDRLAFLAPGGPEKEAKLQLFVMPMNGGDPKRITNGPNDVQQFAWRPDGRDIAFVTADVPENKKAIEKGDDAFEVGDNDYLATAAPMPGHIWLVPAEGGEAKRLTAGTWSLPGSAPPPSLSWSPDGKRIAFVRREDPHSGDAERTTVQLLDISAGMITALTARKELESFSAFSPDGAYVAYRYSRGGDPMGESEVWAAPASGGEGRSVTATLDRNICRWLWMSDGNSLLVGANDGAMASLWLQPLSGGAAKRLALGRVCPFSFYWMHLDNRDGAIAFVGSEPQSPAELYYLASPDSAPRRLTDFNKEIAAQALGRVEAVEWDGPGVFRENGILTFPPDFKEGAKYPLVLKIHGGPDWASMLDFQALSQAIAARGYIVFEPNYRGSDNLGNAYLRAIVKDTADGPGRDVMAGLDAVKRRGFVDERRIAVSGWSYGGFMTTWLIGRYSGWRCAVAGAALTDWWDDYNICDLGVMDRWFFGGSPWVGASEKIYREQSPITYASKIRTPTLILSDTGDARVPITNSYKLFHALKDNGVPVKFIAYPVSGHRPGDPVRYADVCRRWIEWLDLYLAANASEQEKKP